MKYHDFFNRNIGVFSFEEQEKIKSLRVGIAGAGGIGAPAAYALARLGVSSIKIADPEKFEPSNTNRQFGCYVDTLGKYKAESVCSELLRIYPNGNYLHVNEFLTEKNLDDFLDGIDVVIDGIDFFNFSDELSLHRKARERGIWIFTSQAAAEILTFTSFDPKGAALEEELKFDDDQASKLRKAISLFFPILPSIASPEKIEEIINSQQLHISSHSTPPMIGGGVLVEQIISAVIRNKATVVFPRILTLNIEKLTSSIS